MTGNSKSGRKPKVGGVRTSILVDGPTIAALNFIKKREGVTQGEIVEKAVEEYFLHHYETELEVLLNADHNKT